jgi:hypothetical protein
MNQQLESDVHEAFSAFVSGIPSDAGERLRAIDYHPRTGRLSPRLTAGAMIGAAATTTTIVSVIVLGGSQPAFAGWSPSPSPSPVVLTSSADSACQAQLSNPPPGAGVGITGPWSAVATDVRGPFTLEIYQDGDAHATCLTGPSITVVSESSPTGRSTSASQRGSGSGGKDGGRSSSLETGTGSWSLVTGTGNDGTSGEIDDVVVTHLTSTSQGPYTFVEGRAEPGVAGVTIVRSDGEHVQATSDNGWFLAWWPGTEAATSAEITTSAGVTSEVLRTPAPLPGISAPGAPSTPAP